MMYAKGRIEASPGAVGMCPQCDSKLVTKCGSINIWHWAHDKRSDCESWHEPESLWHREWKNNFPEDQREVIMGAHIADVSTKKGVIEFQSSSISVEDIQARENHYKNMVWVLNGKKFIDNFDLSHRDGYFTFHWKHPRKTWFQSHRPIFIDGLNPYGLFEIRKMYRDVPCRGWGKFIEKEVFISQNNDNINELVAMFL